MMNRPEHISEVAWIKTLYPKLSHYEAIVLAVLARHEGIVVEFGQIEAEFDRITNEPPLRNTIAGWIASIRGKSRRFGYKLRILTHYSLGYQLETRETVPIKVTRTPVHIEVSPHGEDYARVSMELTPRTPGENADRVVYHGERLRTPRIREVIEKLRDEATEYFEPPFT